MTGGRPLVMSVPDALSQDEIWIHGERLDTMDRHHRANLIPFLRRNAETLQYLAHIVVLVVTWWAVVTVIESDNQVDTRRPDPTVTVATAPGMAPVLYQEDTDG